MKPQRFLRHSFADFRGRLNAFIVAVVIDFAGAAEMQGYGCCGCGEYFRLKLALRELYDDGSATLER